MRQLLPPSTTDVEPIEAYRADRHAPPGRPWVLVNTIATADGATAVAGRSGPLGGPADRAVFAVLRGFADVVLVGAGTARAEDYGPARARPDGSPGPRIVVVTRSGSLDPSSRLFQAERSKAHAPPLVLTCEACPPERRAALAAVAEVVVVGDGDVDLVAGHVPLAERGATVVCCEGGPILNGELLADDLIDEWCITTAPSLAGGDSKKPAVGAELADGARPMHLDRLLEADGFLFARYLRTR